MKHYLYDVEIVIDSKVYHEDLWVKEEMDIDELKAWIIDSLDSRLFVYNLTKDKSAKLESVDVKFKCCVA